MSAHCLSIEWQPIETAPRDGTDFLAYYPEGRWIEDDNDPTDAGHAEPVFATVRYEGKHIYGNTYFITPNGYPTYWAKLSPPYTKE